MNDTADIIADVKKGDTRIYYDDEANVVLQPGDWIKFCEPDFDDNYKNRAEFIGQITQIESVESGAITIKDEAAKNYSIANNMWLKEFRPVKNIGIENLKIERDNTGEGDGKTINFDRVINSWIRGVETYNCTGYHIKISHSSHILIDGCFIHKPQIMIAMKEPVMVLFSVTLQQIAL